MKAKSIAAKSRNNQSEGAPATRALAEIQLRRASVRITKARVKVLAALLGANRAFSHHEVQDTFADMDRVTLYRALDCLIEARLAHKIAGDDRIFRYSAGTDQAAHENASHAEFQPAQHQHGHFKCTRCAKVFCLERSGTESTPGTLSGAAERQLALRRQLQGELQLTLGDGFQSHDIELTIKGWCADCVH
ncbi:MAG: transcriptional regulator [Burkholderiales bacterium RIFCSPLOWO2_02_FULL_57_36]|nr:MAG: transcriptional regulator [Burkholderiales bacterium RIFCSPLOWO2_02_FULL_57_36]